MTFDELANGFEIDEISRQIQRNDIGIVKEEGWNILQSTITQVNIWVGIKMDRVGLTGVVKNEVQDCFGSLPKFSGRNYLKAIIRFQFHIINSTAFSISV